MDPERVIRGLSVGIAPLTVGVALVTGATVGLGPALLVLAGGMLLGVVLLLWSSLGRLTGESPLTLEEAMGLAAPSAEEERKRSILRALKDLEYERSVGKISNEDFAELSSRYRGEAKVLLRAIEEGGAARRDHAEARLAERLGKNDALAEKKKGRKRATKAAAEAEAQGAKTAASRSDETAPEAGRACSGCSTMNDADAQFCKRCGTALSATETSS